MKKIPAFFIALLFLAACKDGKKKSNGPSAKIPTPVTDTFLVTDSSWGPVTASADFENLKSLYGEKNIKDERICGPECIDSIDVTILHHGTNHEAIVYWKDSAYHKKISMIECYYDSAGYHTSSGLRMGSSLTELLKINGKKIGFYGFGWDYGGDITSYNGGVFDKSPIGFGLDIFTDADNSLLGDSEFDTDMPLVKKWMDKIKVSRIFLSFNKD